MRVRVTHLTHSPTSSRHIAHIHKPLLILVDAIVMRLLTLRSAPLHQRHETAFPKRCEIFTDGQQSCSIALFKALTCNVAEALYLNKQFSHLFLFLGETRWKA